MYRRFFPSLPSFKYQPSYDEKECLTLDRASRSSITRRNAVMHNGGRIRGAKNPLAVRSTAPRGCCQCQPRRRGCEACITDGATVMPTTPERRPRDRERNTTPVKAVRDRGGLGRPPFLPDSAVAIYRRFNANEMSRYAARYRLADGVSGFS